MDLNWLEWTLTPGGLPYKKGGDARREIAFEPLKGTNQKHSSWQATSFYEFNSNKYKSIEHFPLSVVLENE